MAKTFYNALVAARNAVRRNRGLTATYSRDTVSGPITVAPARHKHFAQSESGLTIQGEDRDWLIKASELVTLGLGEPQSGDEIRVDLAGDGINVSVYTVMNEPGEKCFVDSDGTNRELRVHSKNIGTETL
jgi:hypothetical protein